MATRATGAALFKLRARWALFLLFGFFVILASSSLLSAAWPAPAAQAWAVLAASVFFAQLLILWFDLPKNVAVINGKLLPRFGPGTWLSLVRVLALSMLAGFLWPPRPAGWLAWLPFAVYMLFNLADLADGYAARVTGVVTALGGKLDLALDGRGLLIATLLAVHYGVAGWWFIIVGLARYLFVFAAWVHKQFGGTFKLHPNSLRRPLAGAQMGIGVALLAPRLPVVLTSFVSALSIFPFVGNFLFDWLVAAGWLAWLPFAVYMLFNLADLADGYAARVTGVVTALGGKLDLALDSRGLLVATLLAVHYGAAGLWFLLVGLARYLFVFADWIHKQLGGTFKLQSNSLRRPLAGAQMGIGVVLLAPQLPTGVTFYVSTLSMLPFVGNFLIDWLVAAGWLRFKKSSHRREAWLALSSWGLLLTRVALASLLILRLWGGEADLYLVLDLILGLILLFGLAGRSAALALLVETGFRLQGQTVQTLDFAILFVGMILLYLGTGSFSWRSLKEGWIFRHWGAKRPA